VTGAKTEGQAAARIAFVFPGQGAQYVGMGKDLIQQYPSARRTFEQADHVLGIALSRLCFEGPEAELTDTVNAQPAILTMSAAAMAVLEERAGGKWLPAFVAGHSLGEYTALLAADVLEFEPVLRLVRERGRAMKEAGQNRRGAMAAVLGMQAAALRSICEEVGDVWVANDNSPGQIVLSGQKVALERALQVAKERGARRTIPLAVSIAAHSPLMAPAAEAMAAVLEKLPMAKASIPVVANVRALPITTPDEIRLELVQQLTSSVRWVESVQYMLQQGVQAFVEIGPKNVLRGLIGQIAPDVQVFSVGTVADIQALKV
jgi:[acyl-carrier-protein] S-malonyltransferase